LNSEKTVNALTLNGFWAEYTDLEFRIKGCRISISYYFFAMTTALILLCRDYLFFCGIFAAAVHELGHITAIMLCNNCRINHIAVGSLGIRITTQGNSEQPVIIIAGVLSNIVFSLLVCPLLFIESCHMSALSFIIANGCLALCNILPIEPLDGGALLRYCAERHLSPITADRVVFIVSLCTIIPLATAGLFASMQSGGNFSLLILCLWLLAGILRRYI